MTGSGMDSGIGKSGGGSGVEYEWKRTHYCGEVGGAPLGAAVVVAGWVQRSRNLGSLIFADIRDRTGIVQAVFSAETDEAAFLAASELRSEFVVGVAGELRERAPEAVNLKIPTGRFEIAARRVKIYNRSETPPIYIEENLNVNEATRFKYR
ncbi:MAG: hypothetical protein LBU58_01395, partial [Clostridiales bacterium]|nr:hypothetical protein [Clostridiales bacterium]